MDELRERIARALWEHAGVRYVKGQLFCTCGLRLWHPETGFYSDRVKKQIDQPLGEAAQSQHHADVVVAALGMREVATIAWDGEPSMSGKPHRMSLGGDHDPATLRRAILEVGSVKFKPGARVERRFVTEWERDGG